ncbi:hypothetical protein JCGZ_05768 [Jatropha curcas]|uniref:Uncharacterized protein n=1 Tax=Jatropha curcas TaxID=180498 RepID=A0A067KNT3_JATCU|nr:hypothetical protein JCGZ_05768 [Jatropha curcas]
MGGKVAEGMLEARRGCSPTDPWLGLPEKSRRQLRRDYLIEAQSQLLLRRCIRWRRQKERRRDRCFFVDERGADVARKSWSRRLDAIPLVALPATAAHTRDE